MIQAQDLAEGDVFWLNVSNGRTKARITAIREGRLEEFGGWGETIVMELSLRNTVGIGPRRTRFIEHRLPPWEDVDLIMRGN